MAGDFDPRDFDARERDDGVRDREDQWLVLGRDTAVEPPAEHAAADDSRERDDDSRGERDRDGRNRDDERGGFDPRDVFVRDLDLADGVERELVRDRDRDYTLNGSESRSLATVGAFRVVSERDLQDPREERSDVRHLERQGLIERVPLNERERAVTLTKAGRDLLERHQDRDSDQRQVFYAGADKARERTHDTQVYHAYLREVAKLQERDATILRVELDRELKSEYQRFLQERNRGNRDGDGRPDRSAEEIAAWARERDLPYFDDQVHFPDARIEYRDTDGDVHHVDLEITTEHYRGSHGAAASRSGFSIHGSGGSSGGSVPFDPRAAEDFL
jgi:DNA-binding MarR family transcriptional regulator